jgi:hypothetical protein
MKLFSALIKKKVVVFFRGEGGINLHLTFFRHRREERERHKERERERERVFDTCKAWVAQLVL